MLNDNFGVASSLSLQSWQLQEVFKKHQDKARKAGVAAAKDITDYTTEFHFKYTASGQPVDFSIDFNRKI